MSTEHLATKVEVIGKTLAGKELGIRIVDGSGLWTLAFKDGGQIPDSISGKYSSKGNAVRAVLVHLGCEEGKAKEAKKAKDKKAK